MTDLPMRQAIALEVLKVLISHASNPMAVSYYSKAALDYADALLGKEPAPQSHESKE
jgi:hypothetical protein